LYTVWIKTDETLPWIELKGRYQTKSDARKAAETIIKRIQVRVVALPENKKGMKILVPLKASH
jgi:hypothetical protein